MILIFVSGDPIANFSKKSAIFGRKLEICVFFSIGPGQKAKMGKKTAVFRDRMRHIEEFFRHKPKIINFDPFYLADNWPTWAIQ